MLLILFGFCSECVPIVVPTFRRYKLLQSSVSCLIVNNDIKLLISGFHDSLLLMLIILLEFSW
jgi:hypothetical protein